MGDWYLWACFCRQFGFLLRRCWKLFCRQLNGERIHGQYEQVSPNSVVLGALICDFGLGELEIGPHLNFGNILDFLWIRKASWMPFFSWYYFYYYYLPSKKNIYISINIIYVIRKGFILYYLHYHLYILTNSLTFLSFNLRKHLYYLFSISITCTVAYNLFFLYHPDFYHMWNSLQ